MSTKPPVLIVATGDPEGIGPEVSVRAAEAWCAQEPAASVLLVGDPAHLPAPQSGRWEPAEAVLAAHPGVGLLPIEGDPAVQPGAGPSEAGGRTALRVLEVAESLVREAPHRVLVTAPVSKDAIDRVAPPFTGHTEWLAERCGIPLPVMLFAADSLRVALLTVHLPLADVPAALTLDRVLQTLRVLSEGLRRWFGIAEPRIAVLGLNPHAGEGGLLGTEEQVVLEPALAAATEEGLKVTGPWSADTFFQPRRLAECDVVLALYHDQGLLPVKCLAFGEAVNVTLGLPYLRTSVDHGTAFDLVRDGGSPDSSSMLCALRLGASPLTLRAR